MNRIAWTLAALAAVVLAVVYLRARPQSAAPPAPATATAPALAAPDPPTSDFEFEISAGQVRGPLALQVTEGQRVRLRVRSDVADELHVHGYDLSAPLPAGEAVALTFVAQRAGRFDIELHHTHRALAALEVQPR
jgi:hypothetical protein